jgi:hypothetical protein
MLHSTRTASSTMLHNPFNLDCPVQDDGWDAMEGSVSGDGCRPTIGAMMWSEALAIARPKR